IAGGPDQRLALPGSAGRLARISVRVSAAVSCSRRSSRPRGRLVGCCHGHPLGLVIDWTTPCLSSIG
ncbi:hypothetical protein ACFXC8_48230, partial [Streptomyces sp. NPDC059441]|uniref:hypothetical protein n=1 Tax=Streptomyces sp. NPDC059441 TaxID=3346829 RepID=UPI00368771DB